MRSKKVALHKFLRICLLKNSQSVKVWHWFDFYRCYGNKNGRQNRLKIGNWPFWSIFKTCNRGINIDRKQLPKTYYNRWWKLSRRTIYLKVSFCICLCWYLILKNSVSKSLKYGLKWQFLYFKTILLAILVTIATGKSRKMPEFYTWAILLINQ